MTRHDRGTTAGPLLHSSAAGGVAGRATASGAAWRAAPRGAADQPTLPPSAASAAPHRSPRAPRRRHLQLARRLPSRFRRKSGQTPEALPPGNSAGEAQQAGQVSLRSLALVHLADLGHEHRPATRHAPDLDPPKREQPGSQSLAEVIRTHGVGDRQNSDCWPGVGVVNCPGKEQDAIVGSGESGQNRHLFIPAGIQPMGLPREKDTISEDDWHQGHACDRVQPARGALTRPVGP